MLAVNTCSCLLCKPGQDQAVTCVLFGPVNTMCEENTPMCLKLVALGQTQLRLFGG